MEQKTLEKISNIFIGNFDHPKINSSEDIVCLTNELINDYNFLKENFSYADINELIQGKYRKLSNYFYQVLEKTDGNKSITEFNKQEMELTKFLMKYKDLVSQKIGVSLPHHNL